MTPLWEAGVGSSSHDTLLGHRFGRLFPKLTALPLTRAAVVRGENPAVFGRPCFSPGLRFPDLGWEDVKERPWVVGLGAPSPAEDRLF